MTNEAKQLSELREAKNLTQEALADLTKRPYSDRHISAVETGRAPATPEFLKEMSEALKIDAELILVPWMAGDPEPGTIPAQEGSALRLDDKPVQDRSAVGQHMYQNQTRRIFNELDWLAGWLSDQELKEARQAIADGRITDEPEKGRLEAALLRESIRRAKSKAANHGNWS